MGADEIHKARRAHPGASSVGHLRENLAAASLALPAEAIAKLDKT